MSTSVSNDALRERLRELIERRRVREAAFGGMDLHGRLAELRSEAPVHEHSLQALLGLPERPNLSADQPARKTFSALTWETANEVYKDNVTFSSEVHAAETAVLFGRSILMMGGVEHRRYRALVQPAFIRSMMEQWQSRWIDPVLDELIDAFIAKGQADLEEAICSVLPVSTIVSGFGVPREDAIQLHVWSAEMISMPGPGIDPLGASRSIAEYLLPLIAQRREVETDDVLGILARATIEDEDGKVHHLDDDEILSFARLMFPAGAGTTWRQMSIILGSLLSDSALMDRVRADRSLIRNVIEESLRWEPNLANFSRLVTKDTELGGVQIPAGSVVDAVIASANRDPSRWDRPEVFDIDRPVQQHLAFGNGPHVCIGMHLARTELTAALNKVLDRLGNLRLAPGAPPPEVQGAFMRMVPSLPVHFDAA